jgi:microtubule-associated protein-like 1/2
MCFLFTGDIKNFMTEKSRIGMKDVKWYTHNATVGFLVAGESNNKV